MAQVDVEDQRKGLGLANLGWVKSDPSITSIPSSYIDI